MANFRINQSLRSANTMMFHGQQLPFNVPQRQASILFGNLLDHLVLEEHSLLVLILNGKRVTRFRVSRHPVRIFGEIDK
ncbi:hypothetical protein CEXT_524641 [Caerostris extrusa]|uniref:Uncharacterized protein n=1 Tax=Caerostris extrusa TaxID=172846 RepID=A0AAV4SSK2_CAEEX|nr:hypothetical protein CEXT_524641 [Caerostris extrusa]